MGKYGKNRLPIVKFSSHCGQSIRGRLLRGYRRKIGQLQLGRCRHGDVSKLGLSMLLESKIFFCCHVCKKKTMRSLPKFLGTYFSRLPQWMRLCCAMLCQLTSASMVVSTTINYRIQLSRSGCEGSPTTLCIKFTLPSPKWQSQLLLRAVSRADSTKFAQVLFTRVNILRWCDMNTAPQRSWILSYWLLIHIYIIHI